jgi:hypothetical protein
MSEEKVVASLQELSDDEGKPELINGEEKSTLSISC